VILYQVVVLSNGWIGCYESSYFSKITDVEVCQAKNYIDFSSKLDLQK